MVREEEKEKGGESRVKRNTLTCIILREKEAIGILPAVNINFETVRTCAKRKTIKEQTQNASHLCLKWNFKLWSSLISCWVKCVRPSHAERERLQLANSLLGKKDLRDYAQTKKR